MASTLVVAAVLLSVPLSYIIIKLFYWFLSPYIIDKNDPLPRLKPYQFVDPSIASHKANTNFPDIRDKASKSLSIVLPAYNEEDRIDACLKPTLDYLHNRSAKDASFTWEIIVVSDGSSDKTCAIVQERYVRKHGTDKMRLLSYKQNQGKGFAVQQGMLHARGCLILFADADGASEITHVQRLEEALLSKLGLEHISVECAEMAGIAIGSRAHLQQQAEAERTMLRNFLMWGFHFVVKYVGNVHAIKDTQCGFKLFTRQAVKQTVMLQRIRRWCFDPELLMLAQMQNIPICEVQIKWQEVEGSKIQPMRASLNMFRELVLVRSCYVFGLWYKELQTTGR